MNCKNCIHFNVCEKAKNSENYAFPMCKDYSCGNTLLLNLWVREKSTGRIHQVGTETHDSIEYIEGQVVFVNMQSSASTLADYEFVSPPDIDDYVAVTPAQLWVNRELIHTSFIDAIMKGGEQG